MTSCVTLPNKALPVGERFRPSRQMRLISLFLIYEAMQTMANHVHDKFGAVNVLVNNVGITMDHSFERMTPEEWDSVVNISLTGVFNTTKAFYDDIKDTDEGRIINISSLIGEQGNFGQANYAAAKASVHGLTMTLAKELAPTGSTANCVSLGFTETDMFANISKIFRKTYVMTFRCPALHN
jgi:3-oxoacyl-[acyl-carrier protein] reductase